MRYRRTLISCLVALASVLTYQNCSGVNTSISSGSLESTDHDDENDDNTPEDEDPPVKTRQRPQGNHNVSVIVGSGYNVLGTRQNAPYPFEYNLKYNFSAIFPMKPLNRPLTPNADDIEIIFCAESNCNSQKTLNIKLTVTPPKGPRQKLIITSSGSPYHIPMTSEGTWGFEFVIKDGGQELSISLRQPRQN